MLILKSVYNILDTKTQDWLDKVIIISAKTKLETGCLSFSVLQNPFSKSEFTIIEEWESHESINLHFNNKDYWQLVNEINDLQSQPPNIAIFEIKNKKNIQ